MRVQPVSATGFAQHYFNDYYHLYGVYAIIAWWRWFLAIIIAGGTLLTSMVPFFFVSTD